MPAPLLATSNVGFPVKVVTPAVSVYGTPLPVLVPVMESVLLPIDNGPTESPVVPFKAIVELCETEIELGSAIVESGVVSMISTPMIPEKLEFVPVFVSVTVRPLLVCPAVTV